MLNELQVDDYLCDPDGGIWMNRRCNSIHHLLLGDFCRTSNRFGFQNDRLRRGDQFPGHLANLAAQDQGGIGQPRAQDAAEVLHHHIAHVVILVEQLHQRLPIQAGDTGLLHASS